MTLAGETPAGARFSASTIATVGAVLVVWEIVGRASNSLVLQAPSKVLVALWAFLRDGTIAVHLPTSLLTLFSGLAIAIVVGLAIGALLGLNRTAREAILPYINAMNSAPVIAFVPLFILLFGIGYPTRLITVVIFALWTIVINTTAALMNVDQSLVEMSRSYGAGAWAQLRRVRLPDAFPLVRTGLRLGTVRALLGLINGEVLVSVHGLGGLAATYGTAYSMDRLYAIVLFIALLSLVTVELVDGLAKTLVKSAPA